MTEKHDVSYWLKKITADGLTLSKEKKTELMGAYLTGSIGLSDLERDIFMSSPDTIDSLEKYKTIEQKVGWVMSGGSPGSPLTEFKKRFKQCNIYSEQEVDELFSYIIPEDSSIIIVNHLAGFDHPIMRKMRNAYLPLITDSYSVDLKTGKGTNTTKQLFDGPGDAAEQIDRAVGK